MKKILVTLLGLSIFATSIFAAKEVFILVDSSTKLNTKNTQKSISKILGFNKKKKKKNFLEYGDSVSLFVMGASAEDLQTKYFDDFELEQSKKSRKNLKKRKKATYKLIKKLSGKNIAKVIKIPSSDVVFCMDNSGSMYGNNGSNYEIAQDIAQNLVNSIRTNNTKVALVTFGKSSKTVQRLTSSKKKLNKAFKSIVNKDENTNVTAGINTSCNILKNSNADIKKIILLSDGAPYPKAPSSSISAASQCKKAGVEIVTVALPGAKIKYLDKLSSKNYTINASNIDLNVMMHSLQGLPSPIIESLYYMADSFHDYDERVIVMFSSMMQKTEQYNFYTQRSLRNKKTIDKFINSLKVDKQLPNLKNTKVYVQGLSKSVGPEKNSELEAFWKAYFQACGAEVKSWQPNGINLKK